MWLNRTGTPNHFLTSTLDTMANQFTHIVLKTILESRKDKAKKEKMSSASICDLRKQKTFLMKKLTVRGNPTKVSIFMLKHT